MHLLMPSPSKKATGPKTPAAYEAQASQPWLAADRKRAEEVFGDTGMKRKPCTQSQLRRLSITPEMLSVISRSVYLLPQIDC